MRARPWLPDGRLLRRWLGGRSAWHGHLSGGRPDGYNFRVNRGSKIVAMCLLGMATPAMTGCDILLLSPLMPGLVPGIGQPLRGQVLDSATGQPIGAATVVSEVGWATTDNSGRFSLYGAVSRHNISISRAGYTSVTFNAGPIQDDRAYFVDALFPTPGSGELTTRRTEIRGKVKSSSGAPVDGEIVFAGVKSGRINANDYAIADFTEGLPGAVFSGVIAGGQISGGPIYPAAKDAEQPFTFQDYGNNTLGFGYGFFDVPFRPTGTLTVPPWTAPIDIEIGRAFAAKAQITYANTRWAKNVKTEITLDFGILGSVPVARGFASGQSLVVPSVANSKYVLEGRAYNEDRSRESVVIITTNNPAEPHNFDLLTPPDPIFPAKGQTGAGGRPTFSWKTVLNADAYMVQVFEPNIPQPKWRGLTTGTSITFPGFGDGDVNGGALLPGVKYTWEVHAVGSKYGATTPQSMDFKAFLPTNHAADDLGPQFRTPADILGIKDGGPIFRPFRKKAYESLTKGLEFTR